MSVLFFSSLGFTTADPSLFALACLLRGSSGLNSFDDDGETYFFLTPSLWHWITRPRHLYMQDYAIYYLISPRVQYSDCILVPYGSFRIPRVAGIKWLAKQLYLFNRLQLCATTKTNNITDQLITQQIKEYSLSKQKPDTRIIDAVGISNAHTE